MYKRLTALQRELNAPKKQYNKFGEYYYRSLEDILEALKPLLDKYEMALIMRDEIELIGDKYYCKTTAILCDTANGNDKYPGSGIIQTTAYAREPESLKGMSAAQVTGATSSYCRKYCLNALFLIDDVKDPDTRDNRAPEERPTEERPTEEAMAKKITGTQLKTLKTKCETDNVDEAYICKSFRIKDLKELTGAQYKTTIDNWERVKVKGAK